MPIRSDVLGYYSYLPAILLNGDLSFTSLQGIGPFQGDLLGQVLHWRSQFNAYVPQWTIGVAVLNLPAFLVADFLAPLMGYARDGFSWPYQLGVLATALISLNIGTIALHSVLRRNFPQNAVMWSLASILFGTNLFLYATFDAGFSHIHSFALVACLLAVLDRLPFGDWRCALFCGVILGLIVIVRVPNALLGIIYLLYGVTTREQLWHRLFSRQAIISHTICGIAALCVISIQLSYWFAVSGQILLDSYGVNNFNWSHPQVYQVLFGIQKGLFTHTPMYLLSAIGLLMLRKTMPNVVPSITILFPLHLYVVSSWSVWWYGGSYGQRVYVDLLSIFALGLATLLSWEFSARARLAVRAACVVLIIFSMLLTYLYVHGILPYEGLTPKDLPTIPDRFRAHFGFWPF